MISSPMPSTTGMPIPNRAVPLYESSTLLYSMIALTKR